MNEEKEKLRCLKQLRIESGAFLNISYCCLCSVRERRFMNMHLAVHFGAERYVEKCGMGLTNTAALTMLLRNFWNCVKLNEGQKSVSRLRQLM